MGFLRKHVLHNWHLKLFSLVIAYLLWSTFTAEPAAEMGFLAPFEYRSIPATLELVGEPPAQAYVRVRGRPTVLRRLSPQDLTVVVDLQSSQAGESLVRVTFDHVDIPSGLTVVRVSPSELRLQLAPKPSR
jgi:YbbR domain-containing protein